MGNQVYRPLPQLLDTRRSRVDAVTDVGGGVYRVCGFVPVSGPGEATLPLYFPVRFFEKPSFAGSIELDTPQPINTGNYPTASVVLAHWAYNFIRDTGQKYYTGATLLVYNTGPISQQIIVHYQIEGQGLRSPLS